VHVPRHVLRAIAERLPQGAPVRAIEEAADGFLRSSRAVRLLVLRDALQQPVAIRRQDGRRIALPHQALYSTPELLALERQIVDRATTSRHAALGLACAADVDRALGSRPWLSAEQTEMVRRLTTDGDGLVAVVGKAGTGKTTALAAARAAWSASGAEVIGCAVARRAAHELEQGAGIPSTSLTALLRRGSQAIPHSGVVVVDEAGMVGTRRLAELVNRARVANAKLVLVGDFRQLPALEAGGALRMLATRADPIVLRENRRQREAWERDAVELLRDGSVDEALRMYSRRGCLSRASAVTTSCVASLPTGTPPATLPPAS
jgi:ATP-dependent exoDNAse (exonuclease V) alpha subunit